MVNLSCGRPMGEQDAEKLSGILLYRPEYGVARASAMLSCPCHAAKSTKLPHAPPQPGSGTATDTNNDPASGESLPPPPLGRPKRARSNGRLALRTAVTSCCSSCLQAS